MREIWLGYDVTSGHLSARSYVRTKSHNANAPVFFWREIGWVAARVCLAGSCMANCCRLRLFGGTCIANCVLPKSKTINFDDNKIQSQAMNKSTNMESKEREIEKAGDE